MVSCDVVAGGGDGVPRCDSIPTLESSSQCDRRSADRIHDGILIHGAIIHAFVLSEVCLGCKANVSYKECMI